MFTIDANTSVNKVEVATSNNGGLTTEQIMEMALEKILIVSKDAPPVIKEQAEEFKQNLKQVLFYHLLLARREERATLCHIIRKNGNKELADIIRRL